MSERDALARAIRDAVKVGPLGPNSREIHERGGSVALNGAEADNAADALLASDWLAERDRRIKAEALREAAEEWWASDVVPSRFPAWKWLRDRADRIEPRP